MSLKLAVLASGSGTTLQNIIDRIHDGRLGARVVLVISDREQAKALERARSVGIDAIHLPYRAAEVSSYSQRVFDECRRREVDLVVMAGFLKLIHVPNDFMGRIINVHPSLIPAFSGQGCYGHRVHEAVIERGVRISGCTVHFCDNEYDHGPIILQRAVDVLPTDTPDSLAERVQEAEREALPEAIRLIGEGRVKLEGRRVRLS